jgi:hypothetical protein
MGKVNELWFFAKLKGASRTMARASSHITPLATLQSRMRLLRRYHQLVTRPLWGEPFP